MSSSLKVVSLFRLTRRHKYYNSKQRLVTSITVSPAHGLVPGLELCRLKWELCIVLTRHLKVSLVHFNEVEKNQMALFIFLAAVNGQLLLLKLAILNPEFLDDARFLLEGSQGAIGVVILVRITPLSPSNQSIQNGFVEVWKFDYSANTMVERGHRQTLYPIPETHARQKITLPWSALLREHVSSFQLPPDPPPLLLDDLRAKLDSMAIEQLAIRETYTDPVERSPWSD